MAVDPSPKVQRSITKISINSVLCCDGQVAVMDGMWFSNDTGSRQYRLLLLLLWLWFDLQYNTQLVLASTSTQLFRNSGLFKKRKNSRELTFFWPACRCWKKSWIALRPCQCLIHAPSSSPRNSAIASPTLFHVGWVQGWWSNHQCHNSTQNRGCAPPPRSLLRHHSCLSDPTTSTPSHPASRHSSSMEALKSQKRAQDEVPLAACNLAVAMAAACPVVLVLSSCLCPMALLLFAVEAPPSSVACTWNGLSTRNATKVPTFNSLEIMQLM